jgi:preprotein translocase subunit SecD
MAHTQSNLWRFLKRSVLVAAAACAAIALAGALRARAETRRHTVILRLKPDDGQLSRAMQERAAAVLRKRAAALARRFGLMQARVQPEGADALRLTFLARHDPAEALAWLSLRGQGDFCLLHPEQGVMDVLEQGDPEPPAAGDVPPEGYVVRTYYEQLYRLDRPGETTTRRHRYMVRAQPLVRVPEFARVRLDTEGLHKKTVVTFELPKEQAAELRQATTLNGGREMILLIDGNAFFPPRQIGSAIAGGRVQIQGYLYNPPLRALAAVLSAGSLPAPLEIESDEQE